MGVLPGVGAAGLMGGALALEFVASAISAATSITIPASAQTGDLAVLVDFAAQTPDDVTPSGWTQVATAFLSTDSKARVRVSRKILVASDPGASVTGMNGAFEERKTMLVFRPSRPIGSLSHPSWNAEAIFGDPSQQMVSASSVASPLIVIGGVYSDDGLPTFSVKTPAFDAEVTNTRSRVGYKIYNSAPANHTLDSALGVSSYSMLVSGYIAAQD